MAGTVFLTGGSGLVGRAILDRLVTSGRRVRALARSESSARNLEELGSEAVPGDVLELRELIPAMRGCEVAYHAAGLNAHCLADPSPLFRVNVLGSRNVVRAAAAAGIRRVVYTSSAATLGEERGTVGNEDSKHRGWFLSAYERSKYEAEQVVLETGAAEGIEVVPLNPSSVQGPGRTSGTARLLIDYLNGKLNAIVGTRISMVDIADCADAHLLAEVSGKPGERYVVNGATLTTSEALRVLSEVSGLNQRPRRIPPFIAIAAASLAEAAARVRRRSPPICLEMVRTLLHGHAYDGSKAVRELGLKYTPLEDTLRRTVAWYVERGVVSRSLPVAG